MMMEFLLGLSLAAVLLAWVKMFLVRRNRRFETYEAHSKAFYSVAEKLLKEDDISDELIAFLRFMAERIDDKKAAGTLYKIAVADKNHVFPKEGRDLALLKTSARGAQKEKIENLFRQTVKYWLTAIFSRSPFYKTRFLTVMSVPEKRIAKRAEKEWRFNEDQMGYAH